MLFRLPPQNHLERLAVAATYLSLQRSLTGAAWGSFGWGAFTLALGLLVKSHTIFQYVWLSLGALLVLEGVWLIRSAAADPRALLVESVALLLLGLFNTIGLYLEIKSGLRPIGGLQIIFAGIVQLISAYATFRSFPGYKQIYSYLDRACLHELELMIGDMWKRKSDTDPALADFKCDDKKCKAKFFPEIALLLLNNGKSVELVEKSQLAIDSTRPAMLSKSLKVEVNVGGAKLKTEMTKQNLEKWQAWLQASGKSLEAQQSV